MHWIALHWWPDPHVAVPVDLSPEALGWWALQYTPRVAWLDEALVLEVSACERLWGGRLSLMRQMAASNPVEARLRQAQGETSLVALARLRLFARGEKLPLRLPDDLPLDTLSAARDHLDLLARLGCRTWGDVAALPRAGLTRRFGKGLREALDRAWGHAPDEHRWLDLPDTFEQKLELPALAETAPALMWSAQRLLGALQYWLRARARGVTAVELQWTLDLKRFNGVDLPPHQHIVVRTAEPTQDMAHLRRLLSEKLALTTLGAPASWLRLRSVETAPWAGESISFLPEDNRKGDRLHELVERLGARLGADQVCVPSLQADHRPEHMQRWEPAAKVIGKARHAAKTSTAVKAAKPAKPAKTVKANGASGGAPGGDMLPAWLLPEPLRLDMQGERPCYQGALRRLVGPQRIEAGWWGSAQDQDPEEGARPAVRDYYIAESPKAGLVWIYRERPSGWSSPEAGPRWFLQGLYA